MDSVTRHVTLDTDLATAWDLVTRPDDLVGWLGADVVLDAAPGAQGAVIDHDGTRRRLVVDEVDHERRIAWRWWNDDDEDGAASRVEITVSPTPEGTRVTVVEQLPAPSGGAQAFARAQAAATGVASAWSQRLLHLEALLLLAAARG